MKRKGLSVLLSLMLVATMSPAAALADESVGDASVSAAETSDYLTELDGDDALELNTDGESEDVTPDASTESVTVESELVIKVGDSRKLTISTVPEGGGYTCISSNEDVVEVTNSGMVYAVAAGEADITVASGASTATCHVTVVDYIALESISFGESAVTLVQGKTLGVTVNIDPVDADDSGLAFSSSNAAVATVSQDGIITAVKAGTATITATVGEKSAKCTVTVVLPKPTNVAAKANGLGAVKVSWAKVANANGYLVYRSTVKNGSYKLVKTVASGATLSFSNTGLVKGKTYFYKVKARNANAKYNSAFSSVVSAKATLVAPKMKTVANATKTSVKVSWTKPVGTKGYYVYRKKGANGSWVRIKTVKSASTLTYKDTKASGVCYYAVAAYGKNNGKIIVGTRSQAACTRTLAAPKTINASYSSNSVRTVKWSAVTGATGYQVYYKAGDNGSWTLGATLGKVTSYQKKVMHGKYYYFKVRPIYKSDTGTTYGPFKSTAYGWLVYCDPNYVAVVSDEDKPSALYIGLGIINRGKHTMRFYSSDAWYNDRYSSYDRNLAMVDEDGRRINYVDIAPGESKAVMFEVLGSRTWYDKYGKVHAKFRYDGIYYWSSNSYYYGYTYSMID